MHRKSLEAAHQLTSGDESNKDDDDEPGGGNNGGHSSGDETDEHIHPDDDHHKREPKISSNKQHHHYHHLLHLPGPTPTSSAPPQHDASSYMSITNYAAQLQQQRSSVTTLNPTDDFRLNSVAELRAKAAEHQARIAGFGIQQQPQPQQRDGEFLISSDSSSSF